MRAVVGLLQSKAKMIGLQCVTEEHGAYFSLFYIYCFFFIIYKIFL